MNNDVSDLASTKPREEQVCSEAAVPGARSLLVTIERLVDFADHVGVSRINKPAG
jgi:hypothetical protein